ncbi:hypothetical protein [Shewanella xiamenensis]|uniref:hypothetical protein n=1 Tax=Shewanella xiamenensis TaxID=332186 RepID=UPI001CC7343B|nr:hypothetical protein [Shewanella xiamenensis]BDA63121.1 hypothetical protein NUITMVS1_45840 [Shewanella xiamenensis]
MDVATSFIQLDQPLFMPGMPETSKALSVLMTNIDWPSGATCATQEEDGEIIFWKAPVETVMSVRDDAESRGDLPSLRHKDMVHSWYHRDSGHDDDLPELACDWRNAIVTKPEQF